MLKAQKWLYRVVQSGAFLASILCIMLVIGQYNVNEATKLSATCDDQKIQLLSLQLERLETLLIHTDGSIIELKTQLLAHEKQIPWQPFDGPEAKAAKESEINYQRSRAIVKANEPKWEEACNDLEDNKNQSTLILVAIGALLTFMGFKLGKNSEREQTLGDPIV